MAGSCIFLTHEPAHFCGSATISSSVEMSSVNYICLPFLVLKMNIIVIISGNYILLNHV